MAIYHCTVKVGSRSKGQSAVAAAAYRSGSKLTDKEIGQTSDYTHKGGVVFSEISLCKNAPAEYADRETLWNAVHEIEKAKNSRLWREIEVALPQELDRADQITVVRNFVKPLVESGMCADWSLHDKGDGNPHAHIMLTVRSIKENGEWAPKSRKVYDLDENGERIFQKVDKAGRKQYKSHKEDYNDWNKKEKVEEWRALWAKCCNDFLSEEKKIDHRSFERQGKEEIPTIHEGYAARKIVADGGVSERVEYNKQVAEQNNLIRKIVAQLKEIQEKIKEVTREGIENGKRQLSEFADFLQSYGKTEVGQNGSDNQRTAEDDREERDFAKFLQGYGKSEVGRNGSDNRSSKGEDKFSGQDNYRSDNSDRGVELENQHLENRGRTRQRPISKKLEFTNSVRAGEGETSENEELHDELFSEFRSTLVASSAKRRDTEIRIANSIASRNDRDAEQQRQALAASQAAAAAQRAAEIAAQRAAEEERRRIREREEKAKRARRSDRGYGE